MKSSASINLKSKALYFLSRRDYGYHELYIKLQKYSEDLDEIKQVLDILKAKGFLSEERYINSYLRSKQTKYGIKKIRYNLLQKNVDGELLEQILATDEINEYQIAHDIWLRKFGTTVMDAKERARQIRFLQNRGFSYAVISRIVNKNSSD